MSRDIERMTRAIVIPARMESSRFPDKPMAEINGVPMIVHACEIAKAAYLADVVAVVSDSVTILGAAKSVDGVLPVHMRGEFQNGTERSAAWARCLPDSALICVLQCDDPTLDGKDINTAMALADHHEVTTIGSLPPVGRDVCDDDVMLLTTEENSARKVSTVIRFQRGNAELDWHHVGVYIMGNRLLQQYAAYKRDHAETLERLEQLRWQTMGVTVSCVHVPTHTESVNRPEDIRRVERYLRNRGRWKAA